MFRDVELLARSSFLFFCFGENKTVRPSIAPNQINDLVSQSCFVTLGFELILKKLLLQKPFYYCMMYYPDGKSNTLYYS